MPLGFSQDDLANLPTTPYRFVLVTRLMVGTGIVALVGFVYCLLTRRDTMTMEVFNSWLTFLGVAAGLNVVQYGVKRGTDSGMRERVAKAKATAPAGVQVTAEDQSKVNVTQERPAAKPPEPLPLVTTEQPTPKGKAATEPDAYTDDERGE